MDSANVLDIFTCGICLASFDEASKCPRILLCGHSFCHSCLEKLLAQSPCCPTCKSGIQFATPESIPINFSLKSLINMRSQIFMPNSFEKLDLEKDKSEPVESGNQPKTRSGKFLSKGYCKKHEYFMELRCMDHKVWICGLCATLQHKSCRTLMVEEAFKERKGLISQKAEKDMVERKTIQEKMTHSSRVLEEERNCLIRDIAKKEIELKDSEKRIEVLKPLIANEGIFFDKLMKLKSKIKNSADDDELTGASKDFDEFLKGGKNPIPNGLPHFHLPQTREELGILCQNQPVYAVDQTDGTRYGKVAVKDGQIYFSSFQTDKPYARFLNFQELLSQFSGTSELPNTGFLQIYSNNEDYGECSYYFVIQVEKNSLRGKNFILLCSGLKRTSYKGVTMIHNRNNCCSIDDGPTPVIEGLEDDNKKPSNCYISSQYNKLEVYGMFDNFSAFKNSNLKFTLDNSYWDKERITPQFGKVIPDSSVLRFLESMRQSSKYGQCRYKVIECGIII